MFVGSKDRGYKRKKTTLARRQLSTSSRNALISPYYIDTSYVCGIFLHRIRICGKHIYIVLLHDGDDVEKVPSSVLCNLFDYCKIQSPLSHSFTQICPVG